MSSSEHIVFWKKKGQQFESTKLLFCDVFFYIIYHWWVNHRNWISEYSLLGIVIEPSMEIHSSRQLHHLQYDLKTVNHIYGDWINCSFDATKDLMMVSLWMVWCLFHNTIVYWHVHRVNSDSFVHEYLLNHLPWWSPLVV